MDAELVERVLECLRGCEIGESISADGIAEEIGQKLSDVYDALEDLENAKLVELHPAHRKGSDPTYTLTPKGKRHTKTEVQERLEPEPAKEEHDAPELRPSADRVCRFCGKVMEPNKVRRHERFCGANPDRDMPARGRPPKFLKKAEPKEEAAVEETNATAVLEHEVELLFVPNPDHCTGCLDYNRADGTCMVNCVTEESCNHAYRPREPQLQDVPSVDEILGQQQASEDPDVPDEVPVFDEKTERVLGRVEGGLDRFLERVQAQDALVLKGSPGMEAALRLIAFCQKLSGSEAQVSVDATVQISEGFHIHVDLCVPKVGSDE